MSRRQQPPDAADAPDFGILLALAFRVYVDELHAELAARGFPDMKPGFGVVFRAVRAPADADPARRAARRQQAGGRQGRRRAADARAGRPAGVGGRSADQAAGADDPRPRAGPRRHADRRSRRTAPRRGGRPARRRRHAHRARAPGHLRRRCTGDASPSRTPGLVTVADGTRGRDGHRASPPAPARCSPAMTLRAASSSCEPSRAPCRETHGA